MRVNITVQNKDGVSMYYSQETINSFELISQYNLVLPSATVDLQIKFSGDLIFFKEPNLKIKVDFGFDDKTNTYFFRSIESKIIFDMKTSSVTLFCLPVYRSGYLMSQIRSFKDKKSEEVIPTLANDIGFANIVCDIKTDDEQTWIQYNNKNFEFLREVVLHSKLADDTDTSILGLTFEDEFWCVSYNDLMKNPPVMTIKDYIFNTTTIEIGNAEKDLILKPGAKVSEFKLLDGERIPQNIFDFVLNSIENLSDITNDNYVSYKLNFGNTFDLYNSMPLKNQQRWYELENNNLVFELANLDGSLKMFDIVEVKLNTSYNGLESIIDGLYFISGIVYSFGKSGYKTKIRLSKRV